MAIGTPTSCYADERAVGTSAFAFSPTANLALGTVGVLAFGKGGNITVTSITDSKGNTWALDHQFSDGTRAGTIASAQIATAVTTGDTITVNLSSATSGTQDCFVATVSGLATSSVLDQAFHNNGTAATWTTGASATLAQAEEIAFAFFRSSGAPGTKDAAWTDVSAKQGLASFEYKIVAATTALTATYTAGAGTWIAIMAAYKAPASAATSSAAAMLQRRFPPRRTLQRM